MKHKILIVDDDKELLKMLKQYFELKGYEVITAIDGKKAIEILTEKPDIILLDVNMPQMDGLEVCKTIRNTVFCPILFLTARVEESDKVNGLLSGGDDYILKPFSLKELEARVVAHLSREERSRQKRDLDRHTGLYVNYIEKAVYYNMEKLNFTKTEYEIIEFLSKNPGCIQDRERIYDKVRGYDAKGDSRVITELISRIRNKLLTYTNINWIETTWGMGYKWRK